MTDHQRLGVSPPHGQRAVRVDLSSTAPGASSGRDSEAALFWAYRNAERPSEPCICGGSIRSYSTPGAQAWAVRSHNATDSHGRWRVLAGIE